MSRLSNFYLLTYNSLQAFGWTISLYRLVGSFVATKSISGAYSFVGELICFLQIAALLDIIHGAVVPTGVLLPLMHGVGGFIFWLQLFNNLMRFNSCLLFSSLSWLGAYLSVGYLPSNSIYDKKNLYVDTFVHLPLSYYNFIRVLLLVYPLLFLKLYLHLFKKKRSKLGKQHQKKRN